MCPYCIIESFDEIPVCSKNNSPCAFVKRCYKELTWKESKYMEGCKIRMVVNIPDGAYKVKFERKGKLYIDLGEKTICLDNIYDNIPDYVFLTKRKGEYKLKK